MSSSPASAARASTPGAARAALPVRRWAERRSVVLAAVALGSAAIFALGETTAEDGAALGLLFAVPIALAALELGLVAGVAVAVLALGLVAAWELGASTGIGVLGYVSCGVVFLTVGALAGRFSDRMREAGERQSGLLDSGLAIAHLASAADLPLTVARHARAAVAAAGASVELADGQAVADGAVDQAAVTLAIEARGTRYGTLAVAPARPLGPEDHAALATIALQAAVACENQALLASERERATLEAQLGEARRRLSERADQLREVLAGQETERRQVAHQLHEELAQALAAILLGLGALQRDLDSDAAHPRLDTLRAHVDDTLVELRRLAVSLRPPVLDLGLQVALERLAEQARARGLQSVEVTVGGADRRLPRDAQAAVYRIVEDMLEAFEAPRGAAVRAERDELRITVQGRRDTRPRPDRLARIGARADLLGGSVEADGAALDVRIALPAQASPEPGP